MSFPFRRAILARALDRQRHAARQRQVTVSGSTVSNARVDVTNITKGLMVSATADRQRQLHHADRGR